MIGTTVTRRAAALLLAVLLTGPALRAEEYPLPAAAELSSYPPAAVRFYLLGVRELDRVNYEAAYDNLAKAAQLAPDAVRLNMIVAALGLKHGRSYKADQARDFYETSINSYKNVLRQTEIDEDFRRTVQNRLKVAMDERDNLAQRDARREGIGGQFILEFNREVAKPGEDEGAAPEAQPAPAAPAPADTGTIPIGTIPVQTPIPQPQPQQYPPGTAPGTYPGAPPGAPAPGAPQPGVGPGGEAVAV